MKARSLARCTAIGMALAGVAREEAAKTSDVENPSYVMADGARRLRQSVVIAAPASTLWKAFTDTGPK